MKKFNELTNEELLMLTPQGIADLIDLECAINSIPLLPALPVKPVKPVFEKDLTIYNVGDFHFTNQSQALAAVEMLLGYDLISTSGWGDTERAYELSDYSRPKMDTKKIYSEEKYESIKQEIADFETVESEYNKVKKEYDRILQLRKDIASKITDKIEELQSKESRKHELIAMFDRYLELADGNKAIALKFLNNAQSDATDYPEVQELGKEE